MSDIYQYLSQQLPTRLSPAPRDLYDSFTYEWSTKTTGSTMPPSPGVKLYGLNYLMSDDGIHYDVNVEWEPFVTNWMVKHLPAWQVTERSRLVAMAANPLKVNELDHRITQTISNMHALRKYTLPKQTASNLYILLNQLALEYTKYDQEWINSYITSHRKSSLGGGWKWQNAYAMSSDEWKDIIDQLRANIEANLRSEGWYNQVRLNTGIRSRAASLPGLQHYYHPEVMTRSRIILFHPTISIKSVGIPQKAGYYTDYFKEAEDELDVSTEYYYPYEHGGEIYLKFSEFHINEPHLFEAQDGKSWESSVGVILGQAFTPHMVRVQGLDFLPSGSTETSILDTLANMVVTRHLGGKAIILGDDFNYWGKARLREPFLEPQASDTKHRFGLGVYYDPDPLKPRVGGLKVTNDRARAMKPLKMQFETPYSVAVTASRDTRQRAAWASLYDGYFGDRTLLDTISKIKPEEYLSPGEIIEGLIEHDYQDIDAFAWAEQRGIKNLFL